MNMKRYRVTVICESDRRYMDPAVNEEMIGQEERNE